MDVDLPPSDGVLTVSRLNQTVARLLERSMPLVSVRGEMSNLVRAASGHWYFTLKDAGAQVRCAMFRGRAQGVGFVPREGDAVDVRAQVRLYEARGDYQLVVEAMRRSGVGALLEAFNRLRERLAAEGLFDAERKRPVPLFVRRVGVVTSPDAAALRDVVATLGMRAPHVGVIVYPTPVQGDGAAARIAAAIACANRRRAHDGIDALIVCRGGGSIEDLWAFNEEVVARAIVASALPVICGVGHETDVTIADFAADVRAPTPTAAAQGVARPTQDWLAALDGAGQALQRRVWRRWEQASLRLDALAGRVHSPARQLVLQAQRLDHLSVALRAAGWRRWQASADRGQRVARDWQRARPDLAGALAALVQRRDALTIAVQRRVEQAAASLAHGAAVLDSRSPMATLRRGYAIVEHAGSVVSSAQRVQAQQSLTIRFADGEVEARAEQVRSSIAGLGS